MRRLLCPLLCLLLTACLNRPDSLAPVVTITSPPAGTVQRAEGLEVRGYALDDDGIQSIRVNSGEFMSDPSYAGERGNKLVEFGFRVQGVRGGQQEYRIEVADASGRTTTLDYLIQIDEEAPVITIEGVEPVPGNQLRVSGVVTDNNLVARIFVNDEELFFSPAEQRRFTMTTLQTGGAVRVVAYDQAGNRAVAEATP